MKRKFRIIGISVALLGAFLMLSGCAFLEYVIFGSDADDVYDESEVYVAMNEWHVLNDWEVNVSHIEHMYTFDTSWYDYYFYARDGFRFMIVHVSARNNGDDVATFVPLVTTFTSISARLDIGEEFHWTHSNMALYIGGWLQDRFDILNVQAEPGETIMGIIGFEVRTEVLDNPDTILNLHFAQSQSGERLVYNLRDAG